MKKVKNWRKADWDKIRADMRGVNWKRELHGLTVDRMWTVLKRKVEATVKKNVPLRMEACRGRPCWMNREILAAIRRKKRLWRQVRGGGLTEEYREADKKVKNLIRNAKRHFEKKLANKEGGSNRPFFAYIKRKTKSRPCIGPLKDKEKKVVTDKNKEAGECPDHGMAAQEEDPETQAGLSCRTRWHWSTTTTRAGERAGRGTGPDFSAVH